MGSRYVYNPGSKRAITARAYGQGGEGSQYGCKPGTRTHPRCLMGLVSLVATREVAPDWEEEDHGNKTLPEMQRIALDQVPSLQGHRKQQLGFQLHALPRTGRVGMRQLLRVLKLAVWRHCHVPSKLGGKPYRHMVYITGDFS